MLLSTLLLASPALAADALRITSPVAGSSVSGPLTVEGEVAASRPLDVDLSLAPQVLGDCGAPAVTSRAADVDTWIVRDEWSGTEQRVTRAELAAGIPIFELLRRAGLAASGAASRRLIKGGGGRLNGRVIEDEIGRASCRERV